MNSRLFQLIQYVLCAGSAHIYIILLFYTRVLCLKSKGMAITTKNFYHTKIFIPLSRTSTSAEIKGYAVRAYTCVKQKPQQSSEVGLKQS